MNKQWLAVITCDMYGKTEQIIKEVELDGEQLQFVKNNFPDNISYTFRATKDGAELAMQDMLKEPSVISLMS
jgi:hypothetical protein